MFEKLLPFAIAFGVEVIWAKRFKDMNLPQPDWYVSHSSSSHFSSVVFANSLHTGYSMSFASSVSYKSSSGYHSGFSGSGGFSGGGGVVAVEEAGETTVSRFLSGKFGIVNSS